MVVRLHKKGKWGATTVPSTLVSQIISQIKTVNAAYPGEIVITYVETGGFLENLVRMQKGFLDLGISCTGTSYCSYTGTLDFEEANPDLRSLGPMYQTPLNLVVTKASGITRLEDLEGRKLATLPGGTSDRHFRLLLDANDIQPDYQWMGMAASVEAMKGGMADGYLKAGYREAIIMDIAAGVDVTIIAVTPEHIEKLQEKYPGHGLLSGEIPAGLYTFLDEPVFLCWYSPADMVDKDVPEDVVYKIIKAIYENREAIAEPLAFLKVGGYVDMWEAKYTKRPYEGKEAYIGVPFVREELELFGASFKLSKEPVQISDNIMTTGEIPITTDYEGIEPNFFVKEGDILKPDPLLDDLALVVKTEQGLVIILGCAHRGIINTIRHAQRLTREERVHTVVGGTHLDPASKERIDKTIAGLKEIGVQRIGVSHCTGFRASMHLAQAFGDKFFLVQCGDSIHIA